MSFLFSFLSAVSEDQSAAAPSIEEPSSPAEVEAPKEETAPETTTPPGSLQTVYLTHACAARTPVYPLSLIGITSSKIHYMLSIKVPL